MADTKERADVLIRHALVVTMDDRMTVLEDGAVAVRGRTIAAVGPSAEVEARFDAGEVLDAQEQLLMPGLINAHTHSPAVIFRGLTEDMRLEPWLAKSWRFESRFLNPENVRTGALLAQAEMMRGGTTTALDMYWFPEVMAEVAQATGFRLMTGPIYMAISNPPDHVPDDERTARGREFLQQYRHDPLIRCCVQPHSTYTVSQKLLAEASGLANEFDVPFNTHCSETQVELELVQRKEGASPPRVLDALGILSGKTVLAHCIHLPADEIELLAAREVTAAHCPVSNLKIAAGIAPVAAMQKAGVKVTLGTDSAQSSNDLDLWKDMRLAPILAKTVEGDATVMPASKVARMVTCEAARALGLGDEIGSVEVSKQADLILLTLKGWHARPLYDVYAQIVYTLGREDVVTTMIAGKVVAHGGELRTIDEGGLRERLRNLEDGIREGMRDEG